jgi:hypothetical protein
VNLFLCCFQLGLAALICSNQFPPCRLNFLLPQLPSSSPREISPTLLSVLSPVYCVNVSLDPADFLPSPKCQSFSVVNFLTQFVRPRVRAVGQNSPFFLCSHFLQLPWFVVCFGFHPSAASPVFFSFHSATAHIARSRLSLHDIVSLSPEFTGPELAPSPIPVGTSRSFQSPVLTSGACPGSFSVGPGQTSVFHQRFDVISSEILIFDRVCDLLQELIPVLFLSHRIKRPEVP